MIYSLEIVSFGVLWNVLTNARQHKLLQVYKDHANVCVSSELLVIDFLLNNGEDGACYELAVRSMTNAAFL